MDSDDDPARRANNEKGDPPAPPPVQPYCEPILGNSKKNHSDDSKDSSKKPPLPTRTVELLQLAANIVLALVGIFVLLIYSGQLDVMRGQLKNMEGQLEQMKGAGAQTDQLINKTAEQAVATKDLARQAKRSDETLRLRDRAYVYFGDADFAPYPYPPAKPTVWGVTIPIYNAGNMPAHKIVVRYSCPDIPHSDRPTKVPFDSADWKTPEMTQTIGQKLAFVFQACHIPIETIADAQKGKRDVFIIAEVRYTDGFDPDRTRVTQMARTLLFDQHGGRRLGLGASHNCSDDDCPN